MLDKEIVRYADDDDDISIEDMIDMLESIA